jgi:hypothetical protein
MTPDTLAETDRGNLAEAASGTPPGERPETGSPPPSDTPPETFAKPLRRYRLPGITREGIAQLSLLETALWPLQGGKLDSSTFDTTYTFPDGAARRDAHVSVFAPLGLQSIDEYVLWGLLALSLERKPAEATLLATPYWFIKRLGLSVGGFQYDQLRASLERLAVTAYQNTAFYNPVTKQHERATFHFLSTHLPTKQSGGAVDADRAWRVEWSPTFFDLCRATGGTLLFDLDLYRRLTPAARRLFLKLKDRFWRSKRVFLNVDDLTTHGLGFSADRPLKKRKYDLANCLRELLAENVIELGRGQSDVADLFLRRAKGVYVVQLFEGGYFRQLESQRTTTPKQVIADDPLFEPLRAVGIDTPAVRRLLKSHSRKGVQQWLRITDAAMHEKPRGFPGFKASPAAFLIDGVQNKRTPPDWFHAHEKKRDRQHWQDKTNEVGGEDADLRHRHAAERAVALQAFLKTPEGVARFTAYSTAFRTFYERVEPDRAAAAAREAARQKVEREHFVFPDFGVWLLDRRSPNG